MLIERKISFFRRLTFSTFYNPFVIPEKVWAEGEELYLLAGQSPWSGDYYSEELDKHPSGLYVSHDDGMSFEYVGNLAYWRYEGKN